MTEHRGENDSESKQTNLIRMNNANSPNNRLVKKKSKPSDSHFRLQAFLLSKDGKKWQQKSP